MAELKNKVTRTFVDKPHFEYSCPQCGKGFLIPDQTSFDFEEPPHSKHAHKNPEWEPDWIEYRFTFNAVCNMANCGEISRVSGSGGLSRYYTYEHEIELEEVFQIRSFYPAPKLIEIPEDVSRGVEKLLLRSFDLYWVDVGAAANALRASLEALLDDLGVPRESISKKGKMRAANLHQRLEIWSESQEDEAELCKALKEVGNLGSHGAIVREKYYFDALRLFSYVLDQLYENNAEKMKELAKKLNAAVKKKVK